MSELSPELPTGVRISSALLILMHQECIDHWDATKSIPADGRLEDFDVLFSLKGDFNSAEQC